MITRDMPRAGHRSRVTLAGESAARAGLLMDSVVMADNLATTHVSEIDRIIGRLVSMDEVASALRATLGLRS